MGVLRTPEAQALGEQLQHLVLELDAHALETVPAAAVAFAQAIGQTGVGIGLRRLDQAPKALLELSKLRMRYVKLGGYYAQQSLENQGAQFLLEAMIHTAKSQGARIYITDTVSPATAEWLHAQGASLPKQSV